MSTDVIHETLRNFCVGFRDNHEAQEAAALFAQSLLAQIPLSFEEYARACDECDTIAGLKVKESKP